MVCYAFKQLYFILFNNRCYFTGTIIFKDGMELNQIYRDFEYPIGLTTVVGPVGVFLLFRK
ncbi:hypothetical protein SDC9_130129 [bioreactor metagenome]|uniref:Uncharacterized protein n=1 Tax=bioreactor metagenome TaxID=1076179 RepID=A0A645D0W7_9ZZZZ